MCNHNVRISPTSEYFPKSRGETWTVQFSSFELLEALLSGWNFTHRHPLWMDTVILNYTAGGLSWKHWPKLFAKLEEKRETMRQYDNGAIRRTASLLPFLCTPLPQFPISLDEPINFIKTFFASLTNEILVI